MIVVVPYKVIAPETEAALTAWNWDFQHEVGYREMRGELDYYHLMCELWEGGETFCIVEQDIVPRPWQMDSLARCDRQLCQVGYDLRGHPTWALGCTRFDKSLLSVPLRYPEWWSYEEGKRPPVWWHVDGWVLSNVLPRLDPPYTPHRHMGMADHVRDPSIDRPHGFT